MSETLMSVSVATEEAVHSLVTTVVLAWRGFVVGSAVPDGDTDEEDRAEMCG